MNLKKYKRFFAFGCSFTFYHWMTWADIIGSEIPEYYNYAKPGCGNGYIFSSVIEANIRHTFTDDDLVIVMWSGVDREDRYINGSWKAAGSVYHSIDNFYDKSFTQKYSDLRGYLIRDLGFISAISETLSNIDHHFLSMMPMDKVSEFGNEKVDADVYRFYGKYLDMIKPSVYEAVFDMDWNTRQKVKKKVSMFRTETDLHPTPKLHLEYIQKIFPDLAFLPGTIDLVNKEEDRIFRNEYFDATVEPYYIRKYINRL